MRCAALRVALHAIRFAAISRLPVLHCGLLCVRSIRCAVRLFDGLDGPGVDKGALFAATLVEVSSGPFSLPRRRHSPRSGECLSHAARLRPTDCGGSAVAQCRWAGATCFRSPSAAASSEPPRWAKGEAALRCCRVAANSAAVQRHERKPQECPTVQAGRSQRTTGGCVRQDKRLARRLAETTGGDDFVSSMFLKERPRPTPSAAVRCSAVDAARARIACPCTHSAYRQPRATRSGCVRSAPPHAHAVS
jgi:hypothetical protein